MAEPSLLEYARYFGLTQDYTTLDINEHISAFCLKEQFRRQQKHSDYVSNPDEKLADIFEGAAKKYLSPREDDVSTPSRKVAKYFEYCKPLSESVRSQILQDCDNTFQRRRPLKLPLPLLQIGGGNVEKDVAKIRRGIDLDRVLNEIVEEHQTSYTLKKETILPSVDAQARARDLIQKHTKQTLTQETCEITVSQLHFLKDAVANQLTRSQLYQAMDSTLPEWSRSQALHYEDISELEFDIELDKDASYGLLSSQPMDSSSLPPSASQKYTSSPSSTAELPLKVSKPMHEAIKLDLDSPTIQEPWEESINLDCFDDAAECDEADQLPKEVGKEAISEMAFGEHVAAELGENDEKPNWSTSDQTISPAQACEFSASKIPTSDIMTHLDEVPELPELDMDNLSSYLCRCVKSVLHPLNSRSFFKSLPFRVPNMSDAIHDLTPLTSSVLDKYLAKPSRVISSDDMLYKDPGLRILDVITEDEEDLAIEDYLSEKEINDADQTLPAKCLRKAEVASTITVHEGCKPAHITFKRSTAESVNTPRVTDLTTLAVHQLAEKSDFGLGNILKNSSKSNSQTTPPLKVLRPAQQTLGKRKREFELEQLDTGHASSIKTTHPGQPPRVELHHHANKSPRSPESQSESLFSFLELRGKKFQRPMIAKPRKSAELLDDPIECTQSDQLMTDSEMEKSAASDREEAYEDLALPLWSSLTHPRTIVVNSSLLQRKSSLVRYLENTEPDMLDLMYRDLDVQQLPGADMILNANTSILITSIQALDQRPLPGKRSNTGLSETHDNIARLANQYSHLVVMVHYLISADSAIKSRLTLTMSEFTSFCEQCRTWSGQHRCDITPLWVPCQDIASTVEVFNAWVWQVIQNHGHRNVKTVGTLQNEETKWETFLTRFGVNPLAAQLMLVLLKKRGDILPCGPSEDGDWGLRRLAAMNSSERLDLFKDILNEEAIRKLNENLQHSIWL